MDKIENITIKEEMENSFLEYAFSVIYARALPDARDGLKPVQRRIIFQMFEMGLDPSKAFVKSARIVGDVMGKLHPHGDSAIYDALVRLAQNFSLRLPLIDGHGNFGSLDDRPAAARYTEARPSLASKYLNADIKEGTVDFTPNYDNKLKEPEVLPSAFPNLLVNGAMGIAVGMATNMAPHNLGEVVRAAGHLLRNPDCTVQDLMKYVPGPDLPTGGSIVGVEGIIDAYETGRGVFKMRATTKIEKIKNHNAIIATELPYQVGPERIKEAVNKVIKNKKVQGILTVKDLTDRKNGTKIVISIKNGFDPKKILYKLYSLTPLEENFSINNVALVNGQPQTLGIKRLLEVWVNHRLEVITRRSRFRLEQIKDRLHLLQGLLIAIVDIDKVISIIRNSDDTKLAKEKLIQEFKLDDVQAEYILELKLRRLTKFSKIELENEIGELKNAAKELEEILNSKDKLNEQCIIEMNETSQKLRDERRTKIISDKGEIEAEIAYDEPVSNSKKAKGANNNETEENSEFELPDNNCVVVLTSDKMILALEPKKGTDKPNLKRYKHDAISNIIKATTRGTIGVITNSGRLIKVGVENLNVQPIDENFKNFSMAIPVDKIVDLEKFEHIVGIVSLESSSPITMGTLKGQVKRVNMETLQKGSEFKVMGLDTDDEIIGVSTATDEESLVFITTDANLLHFKAKAVRPQGISGGGVVGIKLLEGAEVISFGVIKDTNNSTVVTVAGSTSSLAGTEFGHGKTTPLSEFPPKGRGSQGVRAQRFLKGQDTLIFAGVSNNPAIALDYRGNPVEFPMENKRDASGEKLEEGIGSIGVSIS